MNHGNILQALADLKSEINEVISTFEIALYNSLDNYAEQFEELEERWYDTRNDFYELLEREEQ